MLTTQHEHETVGESVTFDCPNCKTEGVAGQTSELTVNSSAIGGVSVDSMSAILLTCTNCEREYQLMTRLYTLERMSPSEVNQLVKDAKIRPLLHLYVAFALLVCWVPILGIILNGVSMKFRRKIGRMFGKIAITGLVCSILITIIVAAVVATT